MEEIKKLVIQERFEEAIKKINDIKSADSLKNTLMLIEGRLYNLRNQIESGTITPESSTVYLARIKKSLISFLDRLIVDSSCDSSIIKVLVVFSNSISDKPLKLDKEDKIIKEAIKRSNHRDNIHLQILHAASIHDLRRALLEDDFQIVHISVHGTEEGIILQKENGSIQYFFEQSIAALLKKYCKPTGALECVIINSCHSTSQELLSKIGIPFLITMDGPISDKAALEFSRGFYDAIGARKDYGIAYTEGQTSVKSIFPNKRFNVRLVKSH